MYHYLILNKFVNHPPVTLMSLYWLLWIFDFLIAGAAIYFFISGIPRSVNHSNYYLNWFFIIVWLFLILGGSLFFYTHQYFQWAYFLLLSIFVPSILGLLFAMKVTPSEN